MCGRRTVGTHPLHYVRCSRGLEGGPPWGPPSVARYLRSDTERTKYRSVTKTTDSINLAPIIGAIYREGGPSPLPSVRITPDIVEGVCYGP